MNNVKEFHREGITVADVVQVAKANDVPVDTMTYEVYSGLKGNK